MKLRKQPVPYEEGLERAIKRFLKKVDKDGPIPECCPDLGSCWIWTGAINSHGYGNFKFYDGYSAYKFSYESFIGKVPDGLTLDHLCRVRECVNPFHLEPVTMRENLLRGESPSAKNAKKTHCSQGHFLSGENLLVDNRYGRLCKSCTYESNRKWRLRTYGEQSSAPYWTPEEDALIVDTNDASQQLAEKLGRSRQAIRQRRHRLRKAAGG